MSCLFRVLIGSFASSIFDSFLSVDSRQSEKPSLMDLLLRHVEFIESQPGEYQPRFLALYEHPLPFTKSQLNPWLVRSSLDPAWRFFFVLSQLTEEYSL